MRVGLKFQIVVADNKHREGRRFCGRSRGRREHAGTCDPQHRLLQLFGTMPRKRSVCSQARVRHGRLVMKHRTARQLVAQLSYLRHLVRCSALRASATGGTMVRSPSQEVARRAASIDSWDLPLDAIHLWEPHVKVTSDHSLRSQVDKWLAPELSTPVHITEFSRTRVGGIRYVCVETSFPRGPRAMLFFRHDDGRWRVYPPAARRPYVALDFSEHSSTPRARIG